MNQVEFAIKVIKFDDNLPEELKRLEAEGYQMLPGLAPVITYMVFRNTVRPAPTAEAAGFAQLNIDDSKLQVIRNGEPVG